MNFLVNDKVESALVALATAALADFTEVTIYPGKSPEDKALPCVVCSSDGDGEEDPKGTGNFWITATVDVRSIGVADEDGSGELPEPKAADQELVEAVMGAVMIGDLAEQLSAAAMDLTVFSGSVTFGAPESGRDEKGVWIDRVRIRMYCCGSALA